MGRPSDPQSDIRVLRMIEAAADKGLPCPSNDAIAHELGAKSVSAGSACMQRLAKRGMIKVVRFQTGRQVTILATGRVTASPIDTSPHWRDRASNQQKAKRRYAGRRPAMSAGRVSRDDDDILPPVVNRDPCPFCGVRGDIGCGHAPRISMGAFA